GQRDFFGGGGGARPGRKGCKRVGRRALRQACLLRRRYEGHRVPDTPTSEGENARVLPPPHPRVPDDQLRNPLRRQRRLFDGDPLAARLSETGRALLRRSLEDLAEPAEWRELGTALFLDRPLGTAKARVEPDATPLLSCVAFSRSLAQRRLQLLAQFNWLDQADIEALQGQGRPEAAVRGIPLGEVAGRPLPGKVSLADARMVAEDFV